MPPRTHNPRRTAGLGLVGLILALAGCESLRDIAPGLPTDSVAAGPAAPTVRKPGKHWLRLSQYVFYSDSPLAEDDPLFRDLEGLPEQIQRELRLPPGTQVVQVFLFPSQDAYEAFMREHYPWLPVRRAYFIADQKRPGTPEDLVVYTWMGEHLRTDLRHELTHAVLHGVLKGVPLWLDEGLAGFFEQPVAHDGVNPAHLDALRRGDFTPDLARLEQLAAVKQMEKAEYREAWAWTHFFLRGDAAARTALLGYLAELRNDPDPGPLLPAVRAAVADPDRALLDHLNRTELPTPIARTSAVE